MKEVVTVYHGGTEEIKAPLVHVGRSNLDFGPGFYVTAIYNQAKEWARQVADLRGSSPVVSVYHLHRTDLLSHCRSKIFTTYDKEWLDFVTENRLGNGAWRGYDYIEGGVANDRVINTVRLYMTGYILADDAIRRLKYFKPTNQICILNQELLNQHLSFVESINIAKND